MFFQPPPTQSCFVDDDSISEFAQALEWSIRQVAGDDYWFPPLKAGEYNVDCCPLQAFDTKRPMGAPSYLEILTSSEQMSFKCGYDQTNKQWIYSDGVKLDRRFWELGKLFRDQALRGEF